MISFFGSFVQLLRLTDPQKQISSVICRSVVPYLIDFTCHLFTLFPFVHQPLGRPKPSLCSTPRPQKSWSSLSFPKPHRLLKPPEPPRQYAAFSSWCSSELSTKRRELGEQLEAAELLKAQGESAEAQIEATRGWKWKVFF